MLREWQFNVLFFVGVGGAIVLLVGPELGLHSSQNPTAVTGIGAILTYVLTQKRSLVKEESGKGDQKKEEKPSGDSSGAETSDGESPPDDVNPIEGGGDGL